MPSCTTLSLGEERRSCLKQDGDSYLHIWGAVRHSIFLEEIGTYLNFAMAQLAPYSLNRPRTVYLGWQRRNKKHIQRA